MNKQEYYDYVKNTTTRVEFSFKGSIAKDIAALSVRNNISRSKAARFLLLTALKYNFDSSGKYIPSKLRRSAPSEERTDTAPFLRFVIYLPQEYLSFFEACGRELSCYTHGTAAKKLITVALDHDYDDNLYFLPPEFTDCSAYQNCSANDFICLDFI